MVGWSGGAVGRLAFAAGLLLTLTGCGFQLAMMKGKRLESQGDYAGAYEAYDKACDRKPDHEDAEAARDRTRARVVGDSLEAARGALEAADYEAAVEKLDYAEQFDPDHPEVYQVRGDVEAAMRDAIIRNWESGDARATSLAGGARGSSSRRPSTCRPPSSRCAGTSPRPPSRC
ncbi:MAG: hypothetical protein R3F59_27190 [Myxococcota bacterium]